MKYVRTNLDIVAADDCDPSIHHHVLGVKRPEDWPVIIDHLEVDVRDLVRGRKTDVFTSVLCWRD